jgi:hypothetical protein
VACDVKLPCVNGTFAPNNTCICNPGWQGIYCDINTALIVVPTTAPTTPPFYTVLPRPVTQSPTGNNTNTTDFTANTSGATGNSLVGSVPFFAAITASIAVLGFSVGFISNSAYAGKLFKRRTGYQSVPGA